jgi:hypothetical protein
MEFKQDRVDQWIRYNELLELLKATDYKVVKCFEAFMSNEEMPYDYNTLKTQRQEWRNEINLLEEENKL